jgi:hypothetical protein
MSKILLSAACAMLMIVLPGPGNASDRQPDGVRDKQTAAPTEFSSRKRGWSRRHVIVRRAWPHYGYVGPRYRYRASRYAFAGPRYTWWPGYTYWRPRYRYWSRPYRYYRGGPYAYAAYPYYYSWRPRPVFSFSIGFGPRWWW